jgi:hypothetical protein
VDRRSPPTGARQRSRVPARPAGRRPSLDNLKALLIAAIIVMHAVLGYAGSMDAWSYTGVRETTLNPVVEGLLVVVVGPFGFMLMPLFFLMAGLLTTPSLERKGPRAFARDRLVRLGVPFVLFVLAVQPTMMYALDHRYGDATLSYWQEYLGSERQLDTGPLWFVGVLLIFSLAHAATTGRRARRPPVRPPVVRLTMPSLVLLAGLVAVASFAIRLLYPYGGESGFTDLNYWQWPGCLAAFAVGVVGARLGWLARVPPSLAGRCRRIALPAVAAMIALLVVGGALDRVDDLMGGWSWLAAAFALLDAVLGVFGPVWLLSVAQHRLDRRLPWGDQAGRSAYAAFMLQGLFLIGTAVALRPLAAPAEVKALLVATVGVVGSFGAAWLLVSRIPGVGRIV